MKTLAKFEAKSFILISFLFILSLNIFANGNSVVVATYAGTGFFGFQDGDALTEAKFNTSVGLGGFGVGICFDNEGNLLVADAGNDRIRKISPGGVVTTIAGAGIGYLDGPAAIARFDFLADIAVDSIGNIYIADGNNNRIRKLDTAGIVSTLAGSGICAHVDGIGTSASFCTPTGVEIDNEGNILVADLNNSAIRKITPAGVVTTVKVVSAGAPVQVALDKEGNIFFTVFSNRIFKIDTNNVETLVAGSPIPGFADSTGAAARFNLPWGIALDNDGNIYVGDQQNHRVRKIDTNNVVTTLAGTGVAGFKDGPADSAQFNGPSGLCHDATGRVFVADQNNNRIRVIELFEKTATIEGTVFVDDDTSCTLTPGDFGIGNRLIKFEHTTGNFFVFSENDGKYSFNGPPGGYNVTIINNFFTKEACVNTTYSFSIAAGQSFQNANFLLENSCNTNAWYSYSVPPPFTGPCPGFPMQMCFSIQNIGDVPQEIAPLANDYLTVDFAQNWSNLSFVSSTCAIQSVTINPDNTIKVIGDENVKFGNGETCTICFEGDVPSSAVPGVDVIVISALWCSRCEGNPLSEGCLDHRIKNINPIKILVEECSFDPNNKTVTPQGCGINGKVKRGEIFTNKIRFQNVGNAPANRVIIRDTLDTDLDVTTLALLSSSHQVTNFVVLPTNVLVWTFENINLPDSTSDPEGSIGFVEYQINHLVDVPDNTVITNHAAIFFDFNEPIITNTTVNTIVEKPEPTASFAVQRQCAANAYDFSYNGGDENVTFFWDFGPDATPSVSTEQNPTGVTFNNPGKKEIQLTVDDGTGCSSTVTDTIDVEDISCGKNKDKVLVCHIPQGNETNTQLLCVSPESVNAHIAHGDCIGSCAFIPSAKSSSSLSSEFIISDSDFNYINIYPLPFIKNKVNIAYNSFKNFSMDITITNILGEKILSSVKEEVNINQDYYMEINTSTLQDGLYFLVITHNQQLIKVEKIIKVK